MREIILDTETTGLDPALGDRIVEIAAVEITNHILTGRVFHHYFNPERAMSPEAEAIHGLSDAFLADKPKISEKLPEFLSFIEDAKLVIHNAEFDIKFLNAELTRDGLPQLAMTRVIDTLMLARRKHPGQQNSLDALCARYNIDTSRRKFHGALLDCELLADVYAELTGGRQTSFGLLAGNDRITKQTNAQQHNRTARAIPKLSAEGLDAHKQFIATLKQPALWAQYFQ